MPYIGIGPLWLWIGHLTIKLLHERGKGIVTRKGKNECLNDKKLFCCQMIKCLVIVITLVSLTSCDSIGLSKLRHHVSPRYYSAQPPYFVYISLNAIPFSIYFGYTDLFISKSSSKVEQMGMLYSCLHAFIH